MPSGGKREGAGRKVGSSNKTTVDIKALAQSFGPDAIARLAQLGGLMTKDGEPLPGSDSDAAQIAAIKELLDRGFGKSTQILGGTAVDGAILQRIERVIIDPQN